NTFRTLPKKHLHAEHTAAAVQEFSGTGFVDRKSIISHLLVDFGTAFLDNNILSVRTAGIAGKKVFSFMLRSFDNLIENGVYKFQPFVSKGLWINKHIFFIEYTKAGIEVVKRLINQLEGYNRDIEVIGDSTVGFRRRTEPIAAPEQLFAGVPDRITASFKVANTGFFKKVYFITVLAVPLLKIGDLLFTLICMHLAHNGVSVAFTVNVRQALIRTKHHIRQSFLIFNNPDIQTGFFKKIPNLLPFLLGLYLIYFIDIISHMRINHIIHRKVQRPDHKHFLRQGHVRNIVQLEIELINRLYKLRHNLAY